MPLEVQETIQISDSKAFLRMKIVLFQPQIPQNTGNIVRTCSVSGADLILVKPLGFSINDKHLKRAGLRLLGRGQYRIRSTISEKYLEENAELFLFFFEIEQQNFIQMFRTNLLTY
jgi:tRNA (cytidine/uridine-2'-O-)-methyltransferase